MEALKALAQASPSFEAFQSAAMLMPAVQQNPSILMQVVNKDAGIWSQVKG
jgi:hypothetical protein